MGWIGCEVAFPYLYDCFAKFTGFSNRNGVEAKSSQASLEGAKTGSAELVRECHFRPSTSRARFGKHGQS